MKSRCLALVLSAACAADVSAAVSPGQLDPAFGDGGRRLVSARLDTFSPINTTTTLAADDGSIYMAGTALDENNTSILVLARMHADGEVDASFGEQGVITHLPQNADGIVANDAAFDPQGRLLVAGQALVDGINGAIVCRFSAEGAPDLDFGTDITPGCFAESLHGSKAQAVLVQHGTDRIVLAGSLVDAGQTRGIVLGLVPDGSAADLDFGVASGLQFISSDITSMPTEFLDIAQNLDGQLVAAGSRTHIVNDKDLLAFRMDVDGQAYAPFAGDGVTSVAFDISPDFIDEATSAALLEDGSVILAGFAQTGLVSYRPAIVRILADGTTDTSFDYEGNLEVPGEIAFDLCDAVCDMRAHDVTVLPDGKIVLAGSISQGSEGDTSFELLGKSDVFALRLLPSGQPDPTFRSPGSAHAGLSIVPFDRLPPASQDAAYSVVPHGADGLLLGGFAHVDDNQDDASPDYNLAVARIGNRSPMFEDGFEEPVAP